MQRFITLCFILISLGSHAQTIDKAQARQAFEWLNTIRINPDSFAVALSLPDNLKSSRTALVWNDTLAKVAETKALDMATKNYFSHIDPKGYGINYYINKAGYTLAAYQLKSPKANSFESISAGYDTGEEVIKSLIIDKNTPGYGHRKHLLGIDGFSKGTDIGIGFVEAGSSSDYSTYVCIIIAHHK